MSVKFQAFLKYFLPFFKTSKISIMVKIAMVMEQTIMLGSVYFTLEENTLTKNGATNPTI